MTPEPTYGLVMPFVVCRSHGGPYDDAAFVAGAEYANIDNALRSHPYKVEQYVRTATMPQYDLLAMHHGYTLKASPWDECPDEWTHALFTRQP